MDPHGWVGSPWIMVQHRRLHKQSLTPIRCGLRICRRHRATELDTLRETHHFGDTPRIGTAICPTRQLKGHGFTQIHKNRVQMCEFGELGSHQCAAGAWCRRCWQYPMFCNCQVVPARGRKSVCVCVCASCVCIYPGISICQYVYCTYRCFPTFVFGPSRLSLSIHFSVD